MSYSIAARVWRPLAVAVLAASALAASPALAAQQFGSRLLSPGMRGRDVRTLQSDLTIAGFNTRVTGIFDRPTENHVIAFQHRYHLNADGVVGQLTASRITSVVTRARRAKATPEMSPSATSKTAASSNQPGTANDTGDDTGGISFAPGPNDGPVEKAHLNSQGLAVVPQGAPAVIRDVIEAANQIAFKPYVYGGGHGSFQSSGYDCSGSVSFALHGAGLLSTPFDSTQFETYGKTGAGRWISIWANGGHAYMYIAGLRFDTGAQSSSNHNDRWSASPRSNAGFTEVHPAGW